MAYGFKHLRDLFVIFGVFVFGFGTSALQALNIEVVESDKGIKAWLVQAPQNPIIAMKFAFTGGWAHDPENLEGVATLLAATLDEGAGDYDSQAFREILENESISLSFSAGREYFEGNFKTLSDTPEAVDLGFDLLSLALNRPRFDKDPFERMRRQIQTGIKENQADPSYQSQRLTVELIYGDHPFARESDGDLQSTDAIKVDDLEAFKAKHLTLDGLFVAVVGDINADELKQRLDQVFSDLPSAEQTPKLPAVSNQSPGVVRLVDSDQPQTTLVLAQDSIRRDDPDFLATYVVDHILGGGAFTSRLYEEIREKRGLTYGVGTSLGGDLKSPLIWASLQTANETAVEALNLLRQEWQKMAKEGPTQAEMDAAIPYLLGSYALNFTNTSAIAGNLLGMQLVGRPTTYPEDRVALFKALTRQDLQRAAARVLDDTKWTLVATGRPSGLREQDDDQ